MQLNCNIMDNKRAFASLTHYNSNALLNLSYTLNFTYTNIEKYQKQQ